MMRMVRLRREKIKREIHDRIDDVFQHLYTTVEFVRKSEEKDRRGVG
jgi:hypothetical protein